MTKIYWHRITFMTLFFGDRAYMYPSIYKNWNPEDLLNALHDLDLDDQHHRVYKEEVAGISYIEAGKDAGFYYYHMEEV